MDLKLHGKKALICAASEGLGFATAKSLFLEGADVMICGRDQNKLHVAKEKLLASHNSTQHQPRVFTFSCDLATPAGVSELLHAVTTQMGHIDILVNNIGGPQPTLAEETTPELWQSGFDRLFQSVSSLTNRLLPAMKEKKFGRIINITSLSVVEPIDRLAISSAMRSAVTSYAKTLAREVAPYGVTVNCVMPGVIHTARIDSLRTAKAQREGTSLEIELKKSAEEIPAKRLGQPEELGDLIAFLASPKAAYITGANIPVDGGLRRSI